MTNPTRPQPETDHRRLRQKRGGGGRSRARRASPSAVRSNETNAMTTRSVGVAFGSEADRRGRYHCNELPDFTGIRPPAHLQAGPGLWASHGQARPSCRRRFVQQSVSRPTGDTLQLAWPRSVSPTCPRKSPATLKAASRGDSVGRGIIPGVVVGFSSTPRREPSAATWRAT